MKLAAVVKGPGSNGKGPIYVSTNSGATWIQTSAPSNRWFSIACSSDASKLVAAAQTSISSEPIYTSLDGGNSWVSNSVPPKSWYSVACSADGSRLFALASGNVFYVSTNSGTVWISNAAPNNARFIASSADGLKLVAAPAGFGGMLYTSTNIGQTWVTNDVRSAAWTSVASSANGTKLLAANDTGSIYTSANAGTTWVSNNLTHFFWQSVASSAAGTRLAAAGWYGTGNQVGPIYISDGSGTWTSNNAPVLSWSSLACSADGSKMFAAAFGGGIYTANFTNAPVLKGAVVSSALLLSWTIPSTNLVVQQNSDLSTTNWVAVTNTPSLNLANLEYELSVPLSGDSAYFRLASP